MAVKLTNTIGFILLITVMMTSCSANNPKITQPTMSAYDIALERFNTSKTALEKQISVCAAQKTVLPAHLFKKSMLTDQQWKVALYVLNDRAETACESDKRGNFIIALNVLRVISKQSKTDPAQLSSYTEDSLFGHYSTKLKLEAQYLALPLNKRDILEKIPQINKPFDLFKTLTVLEIK